MNADLYLSFLFIAIVFIIIPGPNVWLIISTSIFSGRKRGIQTVLGTSSAMAIQLLIAVLGSVWFMRFLADIFVWFKWLGVIYLAIIGAQHIIEALQIESKENVESKGAASFSHGFIVSITNPKTIIFFTAFLPQFVDASLSISFQMTVLSLSFFILALTFDSLYALFAASSKKLIGQWFVPRRVKLMSGSFLIGLSAAIASSRQS